MCMCVCVCVCVCVQVLKEAENGWWEGELQSRGKKRALGWFPANRVELLPQRNQTNFSITSTTSMTSVASANIASPSHSVTSTYSYGDSEHRASRAKSVSSWSLQYKFLPSINWI